MTAPEPDRPIQSPAWLKALRLASSIYVGLILLVPILVYLCLASVYPVWLMALLGVDKDELWGHPIFVAPCLMFVVAMVISTILRARLSVAGLGAWISHLGLVLLTLSSLYYARTIERGQATTFRTADGWTPVESFYQEYRGAVYIRRPDNPQPTAVPLGNLPRRTEGRPMDLLLLHLGGTEIRLAEILPEVDIFSYWADDAPYEQPGLALELPETRQRLVLVPALSPFHVGQDFILTYRPNATPEQVQRAQTTQPNRMNRTLIMVFTGPDVPPTLVASYPDGKHWKSGAPTGEVLRIPLPDRELPLQINQFMTNAMLHMQSRPRGYGPDHEAEDWALRVTVTDRGQTREVILPMQPFEHLAEPQAVTLADGREVHLVFSRPRTNLPGAFQVEQARYESYPGSVVPKDYRCEVLVRQSGRSDRRASLGLNDPVMVGPYQFTQFQWRPSGENVQQIIFSVASRPAVWLVWVSCILICAGMPYAFYVKPLLRRGRRGQAMMEGRP